VAFLKKDEKERNQGIISKSVESKPFQSQQRPFPGQQMKQAPESPRPDLREGRYLRPPATGITTEPTRSNRFNELRDRINPPRIGRPGPVQPIERPIEKSPRQIEIERSRGREGLTRRDSYAELRKLYGTGLQEAYGDLGKKAIAAQYQSPEQLDLYRQMGEREMSFRDQFAAEHGEDALNAILDFVKAKRQ
jgi:hypothetical protein